MPLPDVAANDIITAAHMNAVKDAAEVVPDAADISFTPAGTIASTNVQDAIEEVAAEAGGGGGGSSIADRRWTASVATADDDEFNDAALDGAWTRVDASGGSSRAVWTEDADSLSLLLAGGDSAGELHALVKPLALAVGDAVQSHVRPCGGESNYPNGGLIVADGNTHGTGTQVAFPLFCYAGSPVDPTDAEWSGYNSRTAFGSQPGYHWLNDGLHTRIMRDSSNLWRFSVSPDGISWIQVATRTVAITPSHVGLAGGTWSSSAPFVFSFDYFRIVTP